MKRHILSQLFLIILLAGWVGKADCQTYPKHEMRAVWIASVENIDWPSSQGLTTGQQKSEMIAILDQVKAYNMNTIVFQVRPDADALYNSALEPWSEWMSGKQGTAPDPYYDPLEFTIAECRKRGLDIHVWLNPYRAIQDTKKTVAAPSHITKIHPEWFLTYGNKKYFDPGIPEVRNYVSTIVADILRRYDIDAIHFDDYFYPYRIANVEFPDSNSFATYPNGFAVDKKDDWRRNNVNLIIKQLHDTIQAINPSVEFGISPFGVWRNFRTDPTGSATKAGVTNYDDLYADILLWQKEGWIDYVTPQLYWYIGKTVADYAILVDWWSRNTFGSQLYIGQAPFLLSTKSRDSAWHSSDEIIRQIKLNRSYSNVAGSMFFSAQNLKRNPLGVAENLKKELFKYPALTPPNPRIKRIIPAAPEKPVIVEKDDSYELSWQKAADSRMFVIYKFNNKSKLNIDHPRTIWKVTNEQSITIEKNPSTKISKFSYAVTSLSPTHHESLPIVFSPPE